MSKRNQIVDRRGEREIVSLPFLPSDRYLKSQLSIDEDLLVLVERIHAFLSRIEKIQSSIIDDEMVQSIGWLEVQTPIQANAATSHLAAVQPGLDVQV